MLWPPIFDQQNHIQFAHTSFLWSNLASNKAAVTCVIVGISASPAQRRLLFSEGTAREVSLIGPYLVPGSETIVKKMTSPSHGLSHMDYGNKPTDGGHLILSDSEYESFVLRHPEGRAFIRQYIGSKDYISGVRRFCFWIDDASLKAALANPEIKDRLEKVRNLRSESRGQQANQHANSPHRFVFAPHTENLGIVIPRHFSSARKYMTVGLVRGEVHVIADSASAIYDATLTDFAVLSSQLHMAWVDTVAGRIKHDYRYSSTLVWNTFPVPTLTHQNKAELTRCAEDILLAREAHFPATIADLYDPEAMDSKYPGLRAAHDRNDETLERIYIGRRFRNDTERLEKLFELYTEMTGKQAKLVPPAKRKKKGV